MGAGGDTAVSAAENLLVVDIESAAFHDATYLTMMVGMMCDRTPNTPFCPLQVLLTMVSTTSARESARNGTDDGECNMTLGKCLDLMENLQAVFLDLAGVFGHLQGEVRSSAGVNRTSKWAEVLTAVLPLALVIAEAENSILKQKSQFDTTKSESLFAWRFRGALVGIISTMRLAACTSFSIRAVFASTSSFSLFAQASAMLLQLAPLCNAPGTDKENAECIKDAVVILATGFRESRNEMLSDEEVGRLLHGVECILHATLRLFGVEENLALLVVDGAPSNEPKASEKRKSSIKRSAEQQHREVILKSLARLNESLGTEGQEALVHVLLFESLVSPIRTLRITALRVLLLVCHPDVSDANRMAGCGPVDPSFFDSLIRAEEFNPLSSAGNLDGAQQALARLSFDAAAGSLQNPLQRVILARAMVGLLHAKYAVVWPIALKMLADLVKIEDTTGSVEKEQHQEHERADSAPAVWGEAEESAKLLKPFVWKGVICKYARLIVFGDIVQSSAVRSHEGDDDDSCGNAPSESHVGQQGLLSSANDPLWYRIQLSDKQRHEKGELVSKDFATAQYKTAAITWNLLANKDGKLLCWGEHYLPAASPTSTHGKMAASRSTDRATLAKTFLSGLADFGHGGASNDAKSTLIAELALELSQVRRGEHPSGVKHLKLLDDRLALALNAYTSVSAGKPAPVDSNKRTSKGTETATNDHVEHLQNICAGLISDPCAKLQRAALDLLRRLKVAPYSQYHEKLIPYCDTQQNLFHFLSSFHVESDIPQEDRADYIATALAITLPKLTGNVTREKLKNQAVLQRRVLSFVTHVTDAGVFAGILQGLVKRLIFDCVMPTKNVEPETFHFGEWWAKWARKSTHCARQLEHLLRQLFNTTKLLSALMQAVGKGFSSFAGTCLHLGINGYLISCRHVLLSVVNGGSLYPASNDHQSDMPTGEEWQKRAGKALNSSNVKALMARMRREATLVVASLFEQFPEEVMETLWDDVNKIGVTSSGDRLKRSLIGQYLAALRINSCGAVAELIGDNQRAAATPLLRLVRSWISSHCTLPLVGAFAETVSETIKQLFYSSCSAVNPSSRSASLGGASSKDSHYPLIISALREGLRCVAALLDAGDETIEVFGSTEQSTLRALLIEPYVGEIFTSLYSLIRRSTSSGVSEAKGNARTVANNAERHHPGVMSFNVATWKELIASVSILVPYVVKRHDRVSEEHSREAVAEEGCPMVENTSTMLSRLLEMCITFVDHPACAKDRETGTAAVGVLETLLPHISRVDVALHYEPLALLFNTVTNPEARLTLCRALKIMLTHLSEDPHVASCKESSVGDGVQRGSGGYALQLAAVGRAVSCMNSFADDNNTLERYDFELRFHTLRSLRQFFHNDGEYCTVSRITAMEKYQRRQRDQIREERDYSGDLDVTIPLHPQEAPVMCVEGFLALAANTIFLIRDPEGTISVLATELLEAMIRYASRQNTCVAGYDVLILKRVIRRVILPSLRRGVVSRDVHIRNAHMKAFGALAQYYKHSFRSFASLYSRNAEHNFFSNVGHVQHRCRLNALSLVRQKADSIHPRDALRVFVPFLLAAVKDFAQGKRDQQNLSEGRAKGYCDVALATLAAIAGALPWEGYYRVLSLLLMNAHECPDLRIPMLRGVVLVLDHFHFLDECSEGGDGEKGVKQRAVADDDEDDDCDVDDEKVDDGVEATLMAELRAKRIKYRSARILHVMEDDILPQLYAFLSDGSRKGGTHGSVGEVRVSSHAVTSVRSEMQKADRARQNTAVLQLPVAVAIMKIVKRFPEDRFSLHAEQLLDEVTLKLRTKNDKHRERARRVLSAMLCETGPGKLSFVIAKLRSHLVHGYQLHVLGYTVVTLLYNLYEPRHDISLRGARHR
uniref:Uncharacterized protein TCIL3000_10_3130 n=1 Tax=Trypanosoma congolense (strain IL3000) TaxID=1068625 RepID=G0UVY6_TRYCI|nr:unnamed protein product [Trypanosoma congolense IL3000]